MQRIGILFALLLALAQPAAAEPAWTRLIGDDTLVVATAPLDSRAWRPLMDKIALLVGPQAAPLVGEKGPIVQTLDQLKGFGAEDLAVLFGVSDLTDGRGFVVAVGFNQPPERKAWELLREIVDTMEAQPNIDYPVEVETLNNLVLIGTPASLNRYTKRYESDQRAERPNLTGPLTAAGEQNQAAIVASLDDESRRVVRELWPALPKPWSDANGGLLADGLRSLALTLSLADLQLDLTARAENAEQASRLRRLMEISRDQAVAAPKQQAVQQDADGVLLLELATSVDEWLELLQRKNAAIARIRWDNPRTQAVLAKLVNQARNGAARQQRMSKFMQVALAMHNYHATHGHFPGAGAFRGKQGKPLLSWRVALMPYLEQQALYNEFHLDEPWDSPHNLALAKRMPDVFADANLPALCAEGKTTFQVPVGEETMFVPAEVAAVAGPADGPLIEQGCQFRDIIDGTSNTVMLVEVAADRAVPWTKPADWEVDLAEPLAGLRTAGEMISGWADGHIEKHDTRRLNPDEFRKVLTRAGKEVVNRGQWSLPEAEAPGQR